MSRKHPFGAVLTSLMDGRGITVAELARRCRRAMSTIHRLRSGDLHPDPVRVAELAAALDLPEKELRDLAGLGDRPFYSTHARAYDLLITDPVEPWVHAVHTAIPPRASILDAGCGTGRHAAGLIGLGHRVDLVDAAPELLALARARCPSARARVADLRTMDATPEYDAATCRGVLNDLITDDDRQAAVRSLAAALRPGGTLFLDVRASNGSKARADGVPRSKRVNLPDGGRLTFTASTTWDNGLLLVDETYDLNARQWHYRFKMRPWTEAELRDLLNASGLPNINIGPGVGRRTPDRLFVVAR